MRSAPSFEQRFRDNLRALGVAEGARVLVALSGGCDSVSLLHLLRFAARDLSIDLTAAHFDHAMRADSDADARWVRGLCGAWRIPLIADRATSPLRSEEDAREARYAFLRRAKEEADAHWMATAHHADDQAETVLFRVLRGTGPAGLAGIAPVDEERRLVRPLLPFWRTEIRAYARGNRLRWREDPTNARLGSARNRIRHDLLPRIERTVARGARRSLVRLAELAHEDEAAWERALSAGAQEVIREEEGAVVLVRERLAGYDWPVAARLLRAGLRRLGIVLDRAGTRTALQFISAAPSGRTLVLPGGARLRTEFGEARIERPAPLPPPDLPLVIDRPEGSGTCRVGGREHLVRWRTDAAPEARAQGDGAVTLPAGLPMPLTVRGWERGDRVRTRAGTKTLKKLFGEARVPRGRRARVPVVADGRGVVVWVPGIVLGAPPPRPGETGIHLVIADA